MDDEHTGRLSYIIVGSLTTERVHHVHLTSAGSICLETGAVDDPGEEETKN